MIRDILKNSGRIVLPALFLILFSLDVLGAEIETELTDSSIEVGGRTSLNLKIAGGTINIKAVKLPGVPGLSISYSGMQKSYQNINGRIWSGVIVTFSIIGEKRGKYRIPSFVFEQAGKRIKSREVTLIVKRAVEGSGRGANEIRVKSRVNLSKKSAYIGEPVIMRYYLLSAGVKGVRMEGMKKQPEIKGFVIKTVKESVDDKALSEGDLELVMSHLFSYALVPAETGRFRVGGGTAVVSINFSNDFFDIMKRRSRLFDRSDLPYDRRDLLFDKINMEILPLPDEGRPAGFHGDVGSFLLDVDFSSEPVNIYQEKRVIVTVKGKGNFLTMTKPALAGVHKGIRVITEDGEKRLDISGDTIEGEKKYIYTFIPERSGEIEIGRFRFSFFNPWENKYETAESDNITFKVKGGDKKRERMKFDEDADTSVDFNPVYFIIILLVAAVGIIFFVVWERKRYRLVVDTGGGESEDTEDSGKASGKVDADDYFEEIQDALVENNSESFLYSADRAIDYLFKRAETGSVPDELIAEIDKLKERIYGYKFGGGKITMEKMEKMYIQLKEINKHVS